MTRIKLRKVGVALAIVVVAVSAGAAVTAAFTTKMRLPFRFAACGSYTFDHVTFLRIVDASEKQAISFAAELASSSNALDVTKRAYFKDKAQSLRSLRDLVELHVRTNGPTYGCANKAEWLLVHQLNYPTLLAMNREKELDSLWRKIEGEVRQPRWIQVIQAIGGQVVAALVALLGFYLAEKREKRKEERRIVLVRELSPSDSRDTRR